MSGAFEDLTSVTAASSDVPPKRPIAEMDVALRQNVSN